MGKKPIIGITMGDPSGNGPELSVKALLEPEIYSVCRPLIVGDAAALEYALHVIHKEQDIKINKIKKISEAKFVFGMIDVLDLELLDLSKRLFKKDRKKLQESVDIESLDRLYRESQIMCGECAFSYVKKVIELAMEGEIDATVTNALNKDYINLAGHYFTGHTEIYAYYTNTSKYTMMLAHENLRVVHVSTHVSLQEACRRVKRERVLEVIRIADAGCRALGIQNPKIGVAGLNPHCGERGMFGREEIEEIQPAIDIAIEEGINIPERAPTPADTVFSKAKGGWYDIVVAMYHDQGHIPLKMIGFVYNRVEQKWDAVSGVNITLGLPIIRTSVDHGTGEGHAGDGNANERSLMNAIDYAIRMANAKQQTENR